MPKAVTRNRAKSQRSSSAMAKVVAKTRRDLGHARHLPGHFYTTPEIYAEEIDKIFMKDWLCVGRVEQYPKVGDYRAMRIAGEPVIICRNARNELRAFANVCRHRGVEVAAVGAGNTKQFSCPYHAWLYDLDGKLGGAPFSRDTPGFDFTTCRLPAIKIDISGGYIFINFDAKAQTLAAFLDDEGVERDGGFAEYVAVPAVNAHAVISALSDAELAIFPTSYDTAEEMLERARLSKGETIVITGAAGGVGTALIQLALIRGARVIAIAGSSKEKRVRLLGAHEFVARENDNVRNAVETLIGEQAVEVVGDIVGGGMFGDLLKLLRRGGRYTTAGAIAGPIQPMDLRDLIYKDLEMYGITCPTPETFSRVVGYVTSGRLRPLLEKCFSLRELQQAQVEFIKRTHVGKFAVIP